MKILFISDIHLGSALFKSSAVIMKLLSDDSYGKIVIIGDIIDTWEGPIFKTIKDNQELINKINS